MFREISLIGGGMLGLALAACDGTQATRTELAPSAAQPEIVSGDGQYGSPGQALLDPLVVRVLDGSGLPVPKQIVNFVVTSGGGSVFAGTGLTDENGLVRDYWTLGTDTTVAQIVEARAVDSGTGEPIVFGAFNAYFESQTSTDLPLEVTNLQVASGRTYAVVDTGLASGVERYTDRVYTFVDPIPTGLQGLPFIRTANSDKNADLGSASFLSFDVNQDVVVYVAHDDRVPRPTWLADWTDTGTDLQDSDPNSGLFSVFRKSFPGGTVTLGSNAAISVDGSMYSVLVQKANF